MPYDEQERATFLGIQGATSVAQRDRSQQAEQTSDAWSEAWGDPALQDLGRRLVASGLTGERAETAVEQVWLFYSYEALPGFRARVPMGIALDPTIAQLKIFLYFPHFPSETENRDATLASNSHGDFIVNVSPSLALAVERIAAPWPLPMNPRRANATFAEHVSNRARRRQLDFVGVFEDDLLPELQTVMNPADVPNWLNTPNSLFGGRTPGEFLDDPLDRRLRDVITRAKFNLPAA